MKSTDEPRLIPVKAKCKFCGRELTLQIDTEYHKVGDRYRLIELAACNHCADLRVRRRNLGTEAGHLARLLDAAGADKERRDALTGRLESLSKRWLRLACDWFRAELSWEPEMVGGVRDSKTLNESLGRQWAMAGLVTRQKELISE